MGIEEGGGTRYHCIFSTCDWVYVQLLEEAPLSETPKSVDEWVRWQTVAAMARTEAVLQEHLVEAHRPLIRRLAESVRFRVKDRT